MPRKTRSVVRDRLVEMLYFLKSSHAYELAKLYNTIFSKVSMRLIYYHLKIGEKLGIFEAHEINKRGDYSWGNVANVIIYSLGKNAKPIGDEKIKHEIEKILKKRNTKD